MYTNGVVCGMLVYYIKGDGDEYYFEHSFGRSSRKYIGISTPRTKKNTARGAGRRLAQLKILDAEKHDSNEKND